MSRRWAIAFLPRLVAVLHSSRWRLALALACVVPLTTLSHAQPAPATGEHSSPRGFSLVHEDGRDWIRAPDGRRFVSRGVCVLTPGTSRDDYDPENPAYAAWRYQQDPRMWAEEAIRRLKTWRFSTVGAWGDTAALRGAGGMDLYLTPVLHVGATAGAPWWDMWDPKVIARMEAVAREQILAHQDDPRVIGYYSDNEMGWWNATLFKMTLEHPPGSGQRQRLMTLLRQSYDEDWRKLSQDFEPEGAENWAELEQHGMLFLKPGAQGIQVMRRFLGIIAERYYSLVHDIIRRHAPQALVLGDRYQSFFYPEVAQASAPYIDAASSNLNAHWNDGTFLRSYLDVLHRWTGKPVFVSEIYLAARDNRSGNRNDSGIFPVVDSQPQRAAAIQNTLTALHRLPYVVGMDWFQYFDEPTHGRGDGENFNFGLVDIHNRPYAELTRAFTRFNDPERARESSPAIDAADGLPRAPSNPWSDFKPTLALKHWDRQRGYIPPAAAGQVADLYACWSPRSLLLGLYFVDIVEAACYRDSNVPKIDRAQWIVHLPGREQPIRARIGAGREPLVNDPGIHIETLSGVGLNVRCVAIMEIPATLLGKSRLRPGETVQFASSLTTHARAYQIDWSGRFTLRP